MLLSLFTGFLTVVLVLDCVFLLLLILIQLPKKEAGLGQAFGSTTTDALFGAGSGNALTRITKWCAGIFFVLTFFLAIMSAQASKSKRGGNLREAIEKAGKTAAVQQTPAPVASSNAPVSVAAPQLNLTSAAPAAATAPKPAASTNK